MPSRRKIAQIRAEMGDFASARQASTQFADPVHHRVCDIDGAGADVGRPLIRRVGDAKEGDRDLDHAIAPYADGTGLRDGRQYGVRAASQRDRCRDNSIRNPDVGDGALTERAGGHRQRCAITFLPLRRKPREQIIGGCRGRQGDDTLIDVIHLHRGTVVSPRHPGDAFDLDGPVNVPLRQVTDAHAVSGPSRYITVSQTVAAPEHRRERWKGLKRLVEER